MIKFWSMQYLYQYLLIGIFLNLSNSPKDLSYHCTTYLFLSFNIKSERERDSHTTFLYSTLHESPYILQFFLCIYQRFILSMTPEQTQLDQISGQCLNLLTCVPQTTVGHEELLLVIHVCKNFCKDITWKHEKNSSNFCETDQPRFLSGIFTSIPFRVQS